MGEERGRLRADRASCFWPIRYQQRRHGTRLPASTGDAGRNLAEFWSQPGARGNSIYPDGGFRQIKARDAQIEGDLKLITWSLAGPSLFDLADDPLEKDNLARDRPQDVNRLLEELEAWRRRNSTATGGTAAKDPASFAETERRLRALGYVNLRLRLIAWVPPPVKTPLASRLPPHQGLLVPRWSPSS